MEKNTWEKSLFFTRGTPERCRVAALASCSAEHAEWRGARAFTSESTSFVNPPLESSHLAGFQRFVRYAEGLSSLFSLSPASVYIGISAHSIMGIIKEMGWVPVGSPSFIRRSAKRCWMGKNRTRGRERIWNVASRLMTTFPARSPFIGRFRRRACRWMPVDCSTIYLFNFPRGYGGAILLTSNPGAFDAQPGR